MSAFSAQSTACLVKTLSPSLALARDGDSSLRKTLMYCAKVSGSQENSYPGASAKPKNSKMHFFITVLTSMILLEEHRCGSRLLSAIHHRD